MEYSGVADAESGVSEKFLCENEGGGRVPEVLHKLGPLEALLLETV